MDNQVLENIFNQAKLAMGLDTKTQLYNMAQGRTQAFRQINQRANQRGAMFSGMPAAMQLQHDASVTIPTGVNIVANATQKMQQNQEQWDEYAKYIKDLGEQTEELNQAMQQ